MAKLLVIEDDDECASMVVEWLEAERYTVDLARDGLEGLERLRMGSYEVVLLDWNMPGMNGIDVLRTYRRDGGSAPVLFLTANRGEGSIETGLDSGADDYLTKPFGMKELSARIRALLRRPAVQSSNMLKIGSLTLDPASHRVTNNGREIQLMPKEFSLLEFFMRHPDAVFSAEALIQRIWPDETETTADSFRSYITRLRQKLGGSDKDSLIETIPRVGYRFKLPRA